MNPHTASNPCLICEGHRDLKPGQGVRCFGYISTDQEFTYCSREESAGEIAQHSESQCYPHRMRGPCRCGLTHGEAAPVPIGESRMARIVATYRYTDEHGECLFRVIRKEPKAFLQQGPNGEWGRGDARLVPYRLAEVIAAACAGDTIYIAEGEKDVEALRSDGLVATCNAGGAGKWLPEFSRYFTNADVVIVADKDEPGLAHARQVFQSLQPVANSVRVVQAAIGKDASDHLSAGLTTQQFVQLFPVVDRESDPVGWKRAILSRSLKVQEKPIALVDQNEAEKRASSPMWPTALGGRKTFLKGFEGVTFLVGGPSAGKTWLAVGSSISAALNGWRVIYVTSEMSPSQILRRAKKFTHGEELPESFSMLESGYGSTVDLLVEEISYLLDERKTLVVLDSISSFVDQAAVGPDESDVHRIGPLKRLTMWALNVRRDTVGEVSFLILSERNAQGETKGRFGDHKADLVVSISKDENTEQGKRIFISKAWEQQLGSLGLFALDPETARLEWVAE